ncbi:histidine phosphatase family protein [Rhizobium sp. TH2]|uniref:SixA phosphatase family protein n=1 Tax=Rhizobium sp. TH2 TaxID=2775403 RepID=UPI00215816CD|nr:histidine phosphatase family protein [Rhizobium sp. TH2]
MPKRLILFRHAKSSWEHDVDDHDRPLAGRGIKTAPVMGTWLAANGLVPDLALVSTARRAQQTWALAGPEFGKPVKKQDSDAIYEATAENILAVIKSVKKAVGTLIVVGHNPGFEQLAMLLMKDEGGEAGARLREKFPTAAVAVLSFGGSWDDLGPHSCALEHFVTPKMLG